MARTERESDSRRREEKWQTCWCCRDQQIACKMTQVSAEKLENTGPAEKKRVASVKQRKHYARSFFAKRKRNRAVSPEHQIMRGERVKVSESCTEVQRKALRRGKNLVFSEETCLEKERVRSKVTPNKLKWD